MQITKKGLVYEVCENRTPAEVKTKDVMCGVKLVVTDHPQSQRVARKILKAIKGIE
jgi:hypothetical protein